MKSNNGFPYCIEHKRELSIIELDILNFIIKDSNLNNFNDQVSRLKVIARCGCGECPTVLFGKTFEHQPIENGQDIAHYIGVDENGVNIGIVLMAKNNNLTELEAYSIEGEDVVSWPKLNTFKKM